GLFIVGGVGLLTARYSNERLHAVYADRTVPLGQIAEINNRMSLNLLALSRAAIDGSAGRAVDAAAITRTVDENIAALGDVWRAFLATRLTAEEAKLAAEYQEARRRFVEDGLRPAEALLKSGKHRDLSD